MKKKTDSTELQCANFNIRGYDIVVEQYRNGEPRETMGPNRYYGMTHEVRYLPNVRYVSTGILLENLVTDWEVMSNTAKRRDQTILFCNPKSTQTLTVQGWTIDLRRYTRDEVLKFLKARGLKLYGESEKEKPELSRL